MFNVEDIDKIVTRLTNQGAQLVGEVVQYENFVGYVTFVEPKGFLLD